MIGAPGTASPPASPPAKTRRLEIRFIALILLLVLRRPAPADGRSWRETKKNPHQGSGTPQRRELRGGQLVVGPAALQDIRCDREIDQPLNGFPRDRAVVMR